MIVQVDVTIVRISHDSSRAPNRSGYFRVVITVVGYRESSLPRRSCNGIENGHLTGTSNYGDIVDVVENDIPRRVNSRQIHGHQAASFQGLKIEMFFGQAAFSCRRGFLAEHNRMLGWMWNERVCFLVVVLRLSAATR